MTTPEIDIQSIPGPSDWPGTWHAAGHTAAVTRLLEKIRATEVGRAVLKACQGKTIHIRPSPISDPTVEPAPGKFFGARAVGNIVYITPKAYDPSSSRFMFAPDTHFGSDIRPRGLLYTKADEALLHELVHVMRHLVRKGGDRLLDNKPVPVELPDWLEYYRESKSSEYTYHYDRKSEVLAIMLTNTYVAEKKNAGFIYKIGRRQVLLRHDHGQPTPTFGLSRFLEHGIHEEMALRVYREQPDMAWDIALAPAAFNPVREIIIRSRPRELFDRFVAKYRAMQKREFYVIAFEQLEAKLTRPVLEKWEADLGRPVLPPVPAHPALMPV